MRGSVAAMGGRRKYVTFHVGAHKTGTTIVQRYLQAHAEQLLRHRVRYVSRADLTPHVGWGERLVADPDRLAGLLAEFRRARRPRLLLASHENVCGHPFVRRVSGLYPQASRSLDALGGLLAPFHARVLLSVRPQHELIESYYLQHVNLGGSTPFETWLCGVDLDALSWRPLVDRLGAIFGADNVEIVDFRRIADGGPEYIRHVLSRVDPGLHLPVDGTWSTPFNPSLSAKGLQLALAANRHLLPGPQRSAVRQFLQRNYSNGAAPRPELLGAQRTAELRERYAGEYAELTT